VGAIADSIASGELAKSVVKKSEQRVGDLLDHLGVIEAKAPKRLALSELGNDEHLALRDRVGGS